MASLSKVVEFYSFVLLLVSGATAGLKWRPANDLMAFHLRCIPNKQSFPLSRELAGRVNRCDDGSCGPTLAR